MQSLEIIVFGQGDFSNNLKSLLSESRQMIGLAISEEYRCLVDILTCLVCKNLVQQAHICPNCSKFYCLECINRQLAIEQKCLNCNKVLQSSMLSNCEELCFDLRETLEKVKLRSLQSARINQEKSPYYCYSHKLEKTYYCQTCQRPLCSDCSVLTEVHRGHDFIKLSIIKNTYEQKMALKLMDIKVMRQQLSKKAELVRESKDFKGVTKLGGIAKLQSNMKSLKEQLKKQLKKLLANSQGRINKLTETVQQWNSSYEKWIKVLKDSSKGKFIEHQHDLMNQGLTFLFEEINLVESQICEQKAKLEKQKPITNYINPQFYSFTFILQNFSTKKNESQYFYTESVETKQDLTLRLKIYPKGIKSIEDDTHKSDSKMMKRQSKHEDYFGIFIELVSAPVTSTKLKHQIILNNHYCEGKTFKREFESQFDVGLCCGYQNYIKLIQLYDQGYYNKQFDFVQIELKIGPCSYYQASKDQLALLNQKMKLRNDKQSKLRELRKILSLKQVEQTVNDTEI